MIKFYLTFQSKFVFLIRVRSVGQLIRRILLKLHRVCINNEDDGTRSLICMKIRDKFYSLVPNAYTAHMHS